MYISGLDLILSGLYLILLYQEGSYAITILNSRKCQLWVAIFWQMPGFILSSSVLVGLDRLSDFAYYFIFILELWHTPIMPIISLLPQNVGLAMPLYYYLLFIGAPLAALIYYLPAITKKRHKN